MSLLVCPQEDEASQADGCHPWDNTCKQAEGKGKAVSEDERRADAARLAAGASENKAKNNSLLLFSEIPPHCSPKEPAWTSLTEYSRAL